MSQSDLPHSETTRGSAPDPHALIGMLENLVPLLLRLQSQSSGYSSQFAPPDPAIQSAMLDHQAAVTFTEDIIAGSLRNLSSYLDAHAARYTGLESCREFVTQATQTFAARDYAQSLALILQAYRAIAALRAIKPELPPIRGTGQGAGSAVH